MIVELLIFMVTALVAYGIYSQKKLKDNFVSKGVKVVPGWPFFGNFFQSTFLFRHFFDDLDDVYNRFPDEKYVGLLEATQSIVMIRDPELIKQITVKDFDHFVDHRQFFTEEHDPLFGGSLLMLKGDKWKDMRATLSPAFTGSKMRLMVPFMDEISRNIVDYMRDEITNGDGTISNEVHVDDVIRRYTNDVIASGAFGLQVNSMRDRTNELYTTGQQLSKFTGSQKLAFMIITMFPKLAKMLQMSVFPKKVNDFLRAMIVGTMEHREKNNIERPDMIQLLMEASKGSHRSNHVTSTEKDDVGFATTEEMLVRDNSTIREWTETELVAQAFIFYFAGFESSASVLVMTIHELVLNPEVQNKLYKEVKEVHDNNKTMSYDLIQNLKYMDMVINETFRKWSPALIMDRECIKTYVLPPPRPGGKPYTVNRGDIVYNVVNSLQMDEKYYPDPHRFDPERFSDENKHKIKPFTFMPFGMGPRNCIGSRFALLELKIFMYNLLVNFEIVKCSKTTDPLKLQPLDFTIKAAGETWVKLRARE